MIFDVAGAEHIVRDRAALELGEDRRIGLAHDVGEDVQPAPVRHADDDLVDAELGRLPDDRLERRHRAFAAVQTEALGAGEFDVQETLEPFRRGERLQDLLLALLGRLEEIVGAFHDRLDPGFLVLLLNMHELDADLGAVGLAAECRRSGEAWLSPGRARCRGRTLCPSPARRSRSSPDRVRGGHRCG